MPVTAGPIYPGIKDGLVFAIDPSNKKSWAGPTSATANNLTGTPTGSISNETSGSYGEFNSFVFDGADDTINFGTILRFQPTESFTLSAWINSNSANTNIQVFMSNRQWNTSPYKGYNFGVRENGSGDYVLENTLYDGSASNRFQSVSSLSLNTWYNVVWTYDHTESSVANKHKIYLNKISQTLTALAASTLSTFTYDSNFGYGAAEIDGANIGAYYDGNIGPSLVYNRALSASEVLQNYNRVKGRFGL